MFQPKEYGIATNIGLCPRCFAIFTDPKNEHMQTLEENDLLSHLSRIKQKEYDQQSLNKLCPCCLGLLSPNTLEDLISKIMKNFECFNILNTGIESVNTTVTVCLNIEVAPALDIARVAVRIAMQRVTEKQAACPNFVDIIHFILTHMLRKRFNIEVTTLEQAKFKVDMSASIDDPMTLCQTLFPRFKSKRKRYAYTATTSTSTSTTAQLQSESSSLPLVVASEISRHDADAVLTYFKSLDETGINQYNKYARDISQSSWTVDGIDIEEEDIDIERGDVSGVPVTVPVVVTTDHPVSTADQMTIITDSNIEDDGTGNGGTGNGKVRKGRTSIEEVVARAVMCVLGAKGCRLHGCGREDIDVRMLGNGRPFALEVLESTRPVCPDSLNRAMDLIRSDEKANGDVVVTHLRESTKSHWSDMQLSAETKLKAYRCLVWSQHWQSKSTLSRWFGSGRGIGGDNFSNTDHNDIDTEGGGVKCLEVLQQTPLRVLHRRTLLRRKKFIYSLSAIHLNDHYFLLDLVTSAGTYVKEFVHSDFGRTTPSIRSILGCP
eukprot:gene9805-20394_t